MRLGSYDPQAYTTDNKSNIPGPVQSRLFVIGVYSKYYTYSNQL